MFEAVDWGKVFLPNAPVLELFVRGTVMYLLVFGLLQVAQRRQSSSLSVTDVLVVVLIADAAGLALGGEEASSIADGALLAGTIMFWSYALNWLAFRIPAVDRFVHPASLPLIKDGRVLHRNMRREFVTEAELRTQLRQQGVEDFAEVKLASLEGDGTISVITYETPDHPQARERPPV